MLVIEKLQNWDGIQLIDELKKEGIIVQGYIIDKSDGFLYFNINDEHHSKAIEVINNHIPKNEASEKQIAKNALLKKLGITEEEAKLLLS